MSPIANHINHKGMLLGIMVLLLIMLMLVSAFRLQVIEGEQNLALASNIARTSETVRAPRGLIHAADGEVLVRNTAVFNVYALPAEVDTDNIAASFLVLAESFGEDQSRLEARFNSRAYNEQGDPVAERVTLIDNVAYEDYLDNYSEISALAGIYVAPESRREYLYPKQMSHILGYLGDVTAEEVEETGLDAQSRIGKEGLEKSFDNKLRGEDGLKITEANLGQGADFEWVPRSYRYGDNLNLSVDLAWQRSLYNKLEETIDASDTALGGAAVVMEVDTGRVKAMVNYPSYDNNKFEQGISQSDFQELLDDDRTPLLNRSIAMQIPTGSVFKVLMAGPLQQEGAITANTVYESGCYELPGDYELCEADNRDYGRLDMTAALAKSSNPYFCQAMVDLARTKGSDELAIREMGRYFSSYHLGIETGIDLPGEQPGTAPSPELKQQATGEDWFLADLCNTVIGQGLVSATPLQMAAATAAIANEGVYMRPQLVESITSETGEQEEIKPEEIAELDIDQRYLDEVLAGMGEAAETGTARELAELDRELFAKTGSSEAQYTNSDGEVISGAHSWVMAIFEHQGKDYVIVVAQQFGGRGFRSVPIVKDFLAEI